MVCLFFCSSDHSSPFFVCSFFRPTISQFVHPPSVRSSIYLSVHDAYHADAEARTSLAWAEILIYFPNRKYRHWCSFWFKCYNFTRCCLYNKVTNESLYTIRTQITNTVQWFTHVIPYTDYKQEFRNRRVHSIELRKIPKRWGIPFQSPSNRTPPFQNALRESSLNKRFVTCDILPNFG